MDSFYLIPNRFLNHCLNLPVLTLPLLSGLRNSGAPQSSARIVEITRACRFCIRSGMEPTDAYNASDLYIRKMDTLKNIDDIWTLRDDMMTFYSEFMREMHNLMRLPRPVIRAMDYIEAHLHDKQSLEEIAGYAGITSAYLSDLFHKETGLTLGNYIIRRRIETARNMLRYTDQKVAEIAEILAFSNASHFQRVFKKETGCTPNQYRRFSRMSHEAVVSDSPSRSGSETTAS